MILFTKCNPAPLQPYQQWHSYSNTWCMWRLELMWNMFASVFVLMERIFVNKKHRFAKILQCWHFLSNSVFILSFYSPRINTFIHLQRRICTLYSIKKHFGPTEIICFSLSGSKTGMHCCYAWFSLQLFTLQTCRSLTALLFFPAFSYIYGISSSSLVTFKTWPTNMWLWGEEQSARLKWHTTSVCNMCF